MFGQILKSGLVQELFSIPLENLEVDIHYILNITH